MPIAPNRAEGRGQLLAIIDEACIAASRPCACDIRDSVGLTVESPGSRSLITLSIRLNI